VSNAVPNIDASAVQKHATMLPSAMPTAVAMQKLLHNLQCQIAMVTAIVAATTMATAIFTAMASHHRFFLIKKDNVKQDFLISIS